MTQSTKFLTKITCFSIAQRRSAASPAPPGLSPVPPCGPGTQFQFSSPPRCAVGCLCPSLSPAGPVWVPWKALRPDPPLTLPGSLSRGLCTPSPGPTGLCSVGVGLAGTGVGAPCSCLVPLPTLRALPAPRHCNIQATKTTLTSFETIR